MKSKILVLAFFLLSACSADQNGAQPSTNDGEKSDPTSGAGGSLKDLSSAPIGWRTGCIQGDNIQMIYSLESSDSEMVLTIQLFSNMTGFCTSAYRSFRKTYSASTNGTNSVNTGFTNLNLYSQKIEYIGDTAGGAQDMNYGKDCGKEDWIAGEWIDVTETDCISRISDLTSSFQIEGNFVEIRTPADSGPYDPAVRSIHNLNGLIFEKF